MPPCKRQRDYSENKWLDTNKGWITAPNTALRHMLSGRVSTWQALFPGLRQDETRRLIPIKQGLDYMTPFA